MASDHVRAVSPCLSVNRAETDRLLQARDVPGSAYRPLHVAAVLSPRSHAQLNGPALVAYDWAWLAPVLKDRPK